MRALGYRDLPKGFRSGEGLTEGSMPHSRLKDSSSAGHMREVDVDRGEGCGSDALQTRFSSGSVFTNQRSEKLIRCHAGRGWGRGKKKKDRRGGSEFCRYYAVREPRHEAGRSQTPSHNVADGSANLGAPGSEVLDSEASVGSFNSDTLRKTDIINGSRQQQKNSIQKMRVEMLTSGNRPFVMSPRPSRRSGMVNRLDSGFLVNAASSDQHVEDATMLLRGRL